MYRHWMTLTTFLVLVAISGAEPAPRQWVLVTAPEYRAVLQPLCEFRKEQGFYVCVLETTDVLTVDDIQAARAEKLCARVNKLCREFAGESYVLLAGAIDGSSGKGTRQIVPASSGTIGRMKGEPTDCDYGSPRDGRLPSVAVGRFPARNSAEAAAMVKKTIELERDARPGPWRRRLTVLAGVPTYNPLVDRLVESIALARLEHIDPAWSGRAIYHNAESRFCVPDAALHDRALRYVTDGQALTLYLGHSSAEGFWAGDCRFLDREDWYRLHIKRGTGVFATFGCCGNQLRGRDGEGYGVAAMRNPHGPAAVLGSHGICYAAMVQLASEGLVGSLLSPTPPERLGSAWLALEDGLARGKMDSLTFSLLDAVDGDSAAPQATQRQEHLEMFVLLGDPALRLPILPDDVTVKASRQPSGTVLAVEGTLPARLSGARVHLTVERTAGSVPADLEPLPKESGPARDRIMLANHDRANTFALADAEVVATGISFEARLSVPAKLIGQRLIVRAYAVAGQAEAQGVLRLEPGR